MLRKLSTADMPILLLIEEASYPIPWSETTFNTCFTLGCTGWVVSIDEKIVGFIIVFIQAEECHIMNLCIAPPYRRQGLGMSLLSHVLIEVKQRHVKVIYLEVRCSNIQAITLYKKANFKHIGVRKNYYPTPSGREDAWIFAKTFSPEDKD